MNNQILVRKVKKGKRRLQHVQTSFQCQIEGKTYFIFKDWQRSFFNTGNLFSCTIMSMIYEYIIVLKSYTKDDHTDLITKNWTGEAVKKQIAIVQQSLGHFQVSNAPQSHAIAVTPHRNGQNHQGPYLLPLEDILAPKSFDWNYFIIVFYADFYCSSCLNPDIRHFQWIIQMNVMLNYIFTFAKELM